MRFDPAMTQAKKDTLAGEVQTDVRFAIANDRFDRPGLAFDAAKSERVISEGVYKMIVRHLN